MGPEEAAIQAQGEVLPLVEDPPEEAGQDTGDPEDGDLDDVAALWGWTLPTGSHETVPYEERCWKCDTRRIHDGCHAGLCVRCCEELRALSAA